MTFSLMRFLRCIGEGGAYRDGELSLAIEEEDHDRVEADGHVVLAVEQGRGRLAGLQEDCAGDGGHDEYLARPEFVQELVPVRQDTLPPQARLERLPPCVSIRLGFEITEFTGHLRPHSLLQLCMLTRAQLLHAESKQRVPDATGAQTCQRCMQRNMSTSCT